MKDLRRGFVAMTPLLPGIAVFGLLYGVLARQAGLTPFQAWGMSMTVFAGASQFVAAGMWDHSAALTIIITTLVINLRHLLMGLSIGPYLVGLPRRWKAALAFWMTDESYALAITNYRQGHKGHLYFWARVSPSTLCGPSADWSARRRGWRYPTRRVGGWIWFSRWRSLAFWRRSSLTG